jgi:hypothetical protein
VQRTALALVAWLALAGANAQSPLTFADVQKAHPGDIRAPFNGMAVDDLLKVLNQNLKDQRMSVSGCNIEWEWAMPKTEAMSYRTLRARVDSRDVVFGGGEVHNGRLLYHPQAIAGKSITVSAPDGKTLLFDSWHTLEIREPSAERYWKVAGAFNVLAEQLARSCKH